MSTILHAISETKAHAPLSSGQTVAVFQQLHNDILHAMQLIEDQRRGMERQGDGLLKLTNDLSLTNSTLQDMKQDAKALGERVDTIGRQASEGLELGERLKRGLQLAREDINFLREGHQKTNTNADILRSDLQARTDDIKALRGDIDEVLKVAVQNLQERTNQTLLNLKALTLDHDKSKKDASVQRTRLQAVADDLKATRNNVENLNSTVGKQGALLAETCDGLAATKTNLEITNAVVYKMNETREATMMDISALKDGMHGANARMDGLQADQAKTARDLSTARDDLANAQSTLNEARHSLGQAADQILALRQGQDKSAAHVAKLSNDLAKVKNLADTTKHHLDVTNSMVLPNLGVGDMAATGFQSGTEGTRSLGGTAGGLTKTLGPQTPRKRREATWVARNIGLVPDRMSWI